VWFLYFRRGFIKVPIPSNSGTEATTRHDDQDGWQDTPAKAHYPASNRLAKISEYNLQPI
jgi:hypothetical protein